MVPLIFEMSGSRGYGGKLETHKLPCKGNSGGGLKKKSQTL